MANFWMKRRLGRKVDAEFKKTLPANATLPPYVRVKRTIANRRNGRTHATDGFIDGDFLKRERLVLPIHAILPVAAVWHYDVSYEQTP